MSPSDRPQVNVHGPPLTEYQTSTSTIALTESISTENKSVWTNEKKQGPEWRDTVLDSRPPHPSDKKPRSNVRVRRAPDTEKGMHCAPIAVVPCIDCEPRNRRDLLDAARCKRIVEFSNKFGFLAYEAKIQRKTERKRIRMERQRRKARLQARGKPRKRAPARSDSDADESSDGSSSSDTDDSDVDTPMLLYKPSTIR
ncbi:hypothetical protein DFH06DRAFT_1152164 [Mycena polygramma]|nr:hypothetical protein DFH06DRAFT_1152164 [Mycena polygramma]